MNIRKYTREEMLTKGYSLREGEAKGNNGLEQLFIEIPRGMPPVEEGEKLCIAGREVKNIGFDSNQQVIDKEYIQKHFLEEENEGNEDKKNKTKKTYEDRLHNFLTSKDFTEVAIQLLFKYFSQQAYYLVGYLPSQAVTGLSGELFIKQAENTVKNIFLMNGKVFVDTTVSNFPVCFIKDRSIKQAGKITASLSSRYELTNDGFKLVHVETKSPLFMDFIDRGPNAPSKINDPKFFLSQKYEDDFSLDLEYEHNLSLVSTVSTTALLNIRGIGDGEKGVQKEEKKCVYNNQLSPQNRIRGRDLVSLAEDLHAIFDPDKKAFITYQKRFIKIVEDKELKPEQQFFKLANILLEMNADANIYRINGVEKAIRDLLGKFAQLLNTSSLKDATLALNQFKFPIPGTEKRGHGNDNREKIDAEFKTATERFSFKLARPVLRCLTAVKAVLIEEKEKEPKDWMQRLELKLSTALQTKNRPANYNYLNGIKNILNDEMKIFVKGNNFNLFFETLNKETGKHHVARVFAMFWQSFCIEDNGTPITVPDNKNYRWYIEQIERLSPYELAQNNKSSNLKSALSSPRK